MTQYTIDANEIHSGFIERYEPPLTTGLTYTLHSGETIKVGHDTESTGTTDWFGYVQFETDGVIGSGEIVTKVEFVWEDKNSVSSAGAPGDWINKLAIYSTNSVYNPNNPYNYLKDWLVYQDQDWATGPADATIEIVSGYNHVDKTYTYIHLRDASSNFGSAYWYALLENHIDGDHYCKLVLTVTGG